MLLTRSSEALQERKPLTLHETGASPNRGSAVLCMDGSSATLTGCLFTQNEGNEAGALYCEACSPTVSDCDFIDTTAEWYAGAFCGSASSATLSGCRFLHNTSPSSGAVTMYYGSEPVFRDCLFQSNWSTSHACGAMLLFCFVTGTIEDLDYPLGHEHKRKEQDL